jgi:sortase A
MAVYAFLWGDAFFFQAYNAWRFERMTKEDRRQTTFSADTNIRAAPKTADNERNSVSPETPTDFSDWAPTRIRSYVKSLSRQPESIIGKLQIPELDVSVMVLEGTDGWTLNRGVGHIENTALPGEKGNVGISGHRDGYFRRLGQVKAGDEIYLITPEKRFTYQVASTDIVDPTYTEVLAPSAEPMLTLVTCFPFYYLGDAPQRFIVKARLVQ